MKVLVVDDTKVNLTVLAMLLRRAGYETVTAGGIEEAASVFAAERPDAVLTDLHMPDADDGVVLARRLRATPAGAAAKIALVTADAPGYVDAEKLFDAVLDKPVTLSDFRKFIGEN